MKSSTRSNDGSVILKAFGKSMAKQMPQTFSLLADVRRLSREYFDRVHRCPSDGKVEAARSDTTNRCAEDALSRR